MTLEEACKGDVKPKVTYNMNKSLEKRVKCKQSYSEQCTKRRPVPIKAENRKSEPELVSRYDKVHLPTSEPRK
jgi:hypothetical protein